MPVHATVDGKSWSTSIWREKSGRTLLAGPKTIRGTRDHRDSVRVDIEYDLEYRPQLTIEELAKKNWSRVRKITRR